MLHRLSRLVALAAFVVGFLLGLAAVAQAATGDPVQHSVSLSSWPAILSIALGIVATHVTDLLTKRHASKAVKSQVNLALTSLAGVLVTVTKVTSATWKDYAAAIFMAWATSMLYHRADPLGTVQGVQNRTGGFGLGSDDAPTPATSFGAVGSSGNSGAGGALTSNVVYPTYSTTVTASPVSPAVDKSVDPAAPSKKPSAPRAPRKSS